MIFFPPVWSGKVRIPAEAFQASLSEVLIAMNISIFWLLSLFFGEARDFVLESNTLHIKICMFRKKINFVTGKYWCAFVTNLWVCFSKWYIVVEFRRFWGVTVPKVMNPVTALWEQSSIVCVLYIQGLESHLGQMWQTVSIRWLSVIENAFSTTCRPILKGISCVCVLPGN